MEIFMRAASATYPLLATNYDPHLEDQVRQCSNIMNNIRSHIQRRITLLDRRVRRLRLLPRRRVIAQRYELFQQLHALHHTLNHLTSTETILLCILTQHARADAARSRHFAAIANAAFPP
jgi:hypothetical protein